MVIPAMLLFWMIHVSNVVLFIFVFISIFYFFRSFPQRRSRWGRISKDKWMREKSYPSILLRLLFLRHQEKLEEKQQLLIACGFLEIDVVTYEIFRRILVVIVISFISIGTVISYISIHLTYVHYLYVFVLLCVISLIFLMTDELFLESIRKRRKAQIVQEIHALSQQLLYYSASQMNLYNKLKRSIPNTNTIRNDLQRLLNEWYGDVGEAMNRFKLRLGTEEGHQFVETLNSLRLHDSEQYYHLIRQRMIDYKEKIELLKESRKETTSYILFVLAGIPILYSFQVFIYPWVEEGKKLFNSLN